MLDLVQPDEYMKVGLRDLKRCKMANIFFDTFMNLDKFLENEQKDPFTNLRVRVISHFSLSLQKLCNIFLYTCLWTVMTQASLRMCAGWPGSSLFTI